MIIYFANSKMMTRPTVESKMETLDFIPRKTSSSLTKTHFEIFCTYGHFIGMIIDGPSLVRGSSLIYFYPNSTLFFFYIFSSRDL